MLAVLNAVTSDLLGHAEASLSNVAWEASEPVRATWRRFATRPPGVRRMCWSAGCWSLVEKITLSDAGAHVDYRVKDEQMAFHQPEPAGPP